VVEFYLAPSVCFMRAAWRLAATGRFNLQLVGLEAAQQSYIRVQGLSLFDFI